MPRCLALAIALFASCAWGDIRPNIIYILCDDLGYGDLSCFNPDSKIQTPHFDAVAKAGMMFTDAHSGSAVCSPTRYGIMTGRYSWRSKLQSGVLGGLSPRLIEQGRLTVPALLKQHGYHTACVGKWHLGMDWVKKEGKKVSELSIETPEQVWNVDFTQPYTNGPNAAGFDYYFGIAASLDMVPYTFLENDRATVLPTVDKTFEMFLGRQGPTRLGPAAKEFEASDVLPELTEKAIDYISSRANDAKQSKPFFLYLPFASPHTPIAPTKDWQGKSGLNYYADFVLQNDHCLGQVLKALDDHGLSDNTLLIVTSDNGCSPLVDFPELAKAGHRPSHLFRGAKADIYEGGHRVPFIARWPGHVKADTKCEQTICHVDLLASCAELVGAKLPDNVGEDSFSILPPLNGKTDRPLREATVHHSANGTFAIRQEKWKLVFAPHSGGWSDPKPNAKNLAELPPVQLYNLASDISEQKNVADDNPEVVDRLFELMQKYISEGRSTPGKLQKNAVAVNLWKNGGAKPPLPR